MLSNQPFSLIANHQACLLLHGLGGGAYEMQLLGHYLHWTHGLSVQVINYPGHDQPSPIMPTSTWPQWYGHILETYLKLLQAYGSVSVIGFSTGCPLALQLAADHPVHKLVLLSPYLSIRQQWYYLLPPEAYLGSIGRLTQDVPRLRLPIRDPTMREAAQQAAFFQTFNLPAVRSAIELIEQIKPKLPQINVPTLIIQSEKDTVVAPAGAKLLYQFLGSPIKRLYWLQQSDHIIPLDLERELVFSQIGNFLRD